MDTQANGSNGNSGTKAKQPGTTFNVKRKVGQDENGKNKWAQVGRVFIRADGSGGAAFIPDANGNEVTFNLFPKDRKAAAPGGTAQPKPAQAVGAAAPATGAWG